MKKIFLLVFSISLFLVSCNNNDNVNSNEIIGSWEYSKTGSVVDGKEILTLPT